jgi:hypothetical protein
MANNDYSKFYENYMSKLKQQAQKAVQEAQEKTFSDFFAVAEEKVKKIYYETISDFYSDYSPLYYERDYSLYNLLITKKGKGYLSMSFDPALIASRTGYSGEDGLYNTVFREGWHGGAMDYNTGYMRWRKPVPYYKYWGRNASHSNISPLFDFRQRINDYQKYEYQNDYIKIWNKNKANIKIEM